MWFDSSPEHASPSWKKFPEGFLYWAAEWRKLQLSLHQTPIGRNKEEFERAIKQLFTICGRIA